jgi:hypothetical protein
MGKPVDASAVGRALRATRGFVTDACPVCGRPFEGYAGRMYCRRRATRRLGVSVTLSEPVSRAAATGSAGNGLAWTEVQGPTERGATKLLL